jgi:dolichol-phosphate mannosyltransferase
MKPLVVVPTYNERENIRPLVKAVLAVEPALHMLVVDDNSPDGTGQLADELAAETDRVHVLHRASKQGLGTAYIAGFQHALAHDYTHVVEMDADFSHRPGDVARLLQATEHADVVIGSRWIPDGRVEGWSIVRRIISVGGSRYAQTLLSLPIADCTSGFKCFRREALRALDLERVASNGYGFQVEINHLCHRAGLRMVEIPIVFPNRMAGRSKMSWQIVVEAAAVVWRLRRQSRSPHVPSPYLYHTAQPTPDPDA